MQERFNLKLRFHEVKAVFKILEQIFKEGTYADKAIEQMMRANKKWNVYQRSFVSDATYDIIRHWRKIHAVGNIEPGFSEKNKWSIFGTWLLLNDYRLPDYQGLKHINTQVIPDRIEKLKKIRKVWESVPDWMDDLCMKEIGPRWDKIIAAMNRPAHTVVRANRLKTTAEELHKAFEIINIETNYINWAPDALELTFNRNLFRTEEFKQGLFEIQDAGSQMVSAFLDITPGMRVVDACAGAGGKTLHLAALMKNKGRIIAMDTKEWKLKELKKRASRAGVSIVEARVIDGTKTIKRLNNTAERLLLDLPCSGLGVLRRNPDAKWKMQPEEIDRVRLQQMEIMERFAPVVKVGGKMVYAVCSILPSEGEEQVAQFLKQHADMWELEAEKRYSPEIHDCDGFYMARLKKIK